MKKVIFMGTPEFSVPVLEGLIENYDVIAVVTQPDKQVGRKKEIVFSKVKEVALKHNIKVYQPYKIKEDYQDLLKLNADIIITCAYGQIIPSVLLDFFPYKAINVHASLLPKLRGGSPIHTALIKGYEKTGITIMYMDASMDTGNIISQKETLIDIDDNLETLSKRLSIMGRELLLETLPKIFKEENESIKQDDKLATYAYNITREEEKIDFNNKALDIYNQVRGLYKTPGAYTIIDNKIIKVYKVAIGEETHVKAGTITSISKEGIKIATLDKEVILKEVKPEGKNIMAIKDYINGLKNLHENDIIK